MKRQLNICKAECGCITDQKKCPMCNGPVKEFERKKDSKKAKRFPRLLTPQIIEQRRVAQIIAHKCADFGCPGEVESCKSGPVVTVYKFHPYRYTRIKALKTLHEDLAVAIPAEQVTVRRAMGEMAMAITVPNKERTTVDFKSTLKNVEAHRYDMELPINLGVQSTGEPVIFDLARAPHMLIAGSTGTGKSVLINGILTSLLHVRNAHQLHLYLIDPKSVELLPYSGLPHVKRPPVSAVMDAMALMANLVEEMKRRMSFLFYQNVKNLKELNNKMEAKGEKKLPYIVLVIDEMADLVVHEKKLFTEHMIQISSMARAAGIHVIGATQRPSVDVLSGKIKVNFPVRVGLRLPSSADSKTVFSRSGAEQLLGKGDGFFMNPDAPDLVRIHVPFCTEEDIAAMLQKSTDLGHGNKCPADGPATPAAPAGEQKELELNTTPEEGEHGTPSQGPSMLLSRFLRERGTTWEKVQQLPLTEKSLLQADFRRWQQVQRRQRNIV